MRRNRILVAAAAAILLGSFLLSSCSKTEENKPPDRVVLQLKWLHQAQFAGFYVAKEQGFYKAENLDVEFLAGGKGVDPAEAVASGRADFAVVAPEDLLIRRNQGTPITAIAAIYRRSAVVYITRVDSGIESPFDLVGKTVAVGGDAKDIRDFKIQFDALVKTLGLEDAQIRRATYDPSLQSFIRGEVDVTPAYFTGGAVLIKNAGLETNVIWPGDYGIRFYSDILIASAEALSERPEVATRFLRASLKGWKAAVGDTALAVEATLKYAQIKDREIQTAMMEAQMPLIHTGEDHIGWMKRSDWEVMNRILAEQGFLSSPLSPIEDVFTMCFLQNAYSQGPLK